MPTPGYVFKDGQPIPDDELAEQSKATAQETQAKEAKEELSTVTRQTSTTTWTTSPINTPTSSKSGDTAADAPTESHALAEADHEEKGAAQEHHFEAEVKDLGWNEHPESVPKPLVGGFQNEDLWLQVRRFNKVN